jgi:hypothetical protein
MRLRSAFYVSALGLAHLAYGSTYVVNSSGSGDLPTIQAAINAAADGDTVALEDGTFNGDGNRDLSLLGKAIVVRSLSGNPSACLIDAQGTVYENHRGVAFTGTEGSDTVLEGITIRRGRMDSSEPARGGLAADACADYLPADTPPDHRDASTSGGGILCGEYSGPTIRNCVLDNNRAINGAGLALAYAAHPTIIDCVFSQNYAGDGGGIGYVTRGDVTSATVIHSTFVGNSAPVPGHGAGVAVTGTDHFVDCTFTQNHGGWGAGFFACGTMGPPQFIRCTISRNYGPGGMT